MFLVLQATHAEAVPHIIRVQVRIGIVVVQVHVIRTVTASSRTPEVRVLPYVVELTIGVVPVASRQRRKAVLAS